MLLRSNTFTSSGGYLLPPYNTVHKFAAIVLDDVERVVIGDSSEDAGVDCNYFSHSNFGIKASNSSVEVYHSNFENITALDPQLYKVLGAGIFVQSASDYNDRHLIVGNKNYSVGANTSPNHFIQMNYGIVANGELNCKLFNNVFGNGNPDARITKYDIWTNGTMKKEVYITRGNEFYDYYVGINSFGIHPDAIYHIGYNNFNNSYIPNWSVVNSFQGTAIYMANSYLSPTVVSTLETPQINIYNNEIGQINQEIEPRIGIFTSLIYQPVIQNNNIYYYRNSPVSKPHSIGIWLQACVRPKVAGNLMLEPINTYPGYGANLIGMQLDRNINPCVGSQNIMENLGFGINFKDNNGQVGLSTNQFTNCDNGINLDFAEIGVQGDPDRTDDNEWTDRNVSPVPNRVNGNTQSGLNFSWYYKPTPPEFSPLPSNIVDDHDINPTLPILNCPTIQNVASRNLTFGAVVADSARYDENYQSSFRYNGKVITYKVLKSDTSLIDMDDESDASFIDFYYSMNQSNIEKYDSVASLISQREFAMAASILTGINDTNEQEEYLSAFYNLYLSKIVFDSTLSVQDSSFLLDMAYSHSLLYGDAVYMARNALFLEVHDETLNSNLRRAVFSKQLLASNFTTRPNPASLQTQVRLNDEEYDGRVQLLDGHGQLMMDRNLQNGWLDIKNLNPGIYFIKAIGEETYPLLCKLIIIR